MAVLSYLAAVMDVVDSASSRSGAHQPRGHPARVTVYLPIEASVLVTPEWHYDPNARDVRYKNQSLRDLLRLGTPREVPKGVSFVNL